MSSESNGAPRVFQDGARYHLPKDTPEHERLDAQSASLINLMNGQPFRAPLSNPQRILDVGCGTGTTTHLLGTIYPNAEVIGIDLAPVPESRHGRLPNVTYVQGDISQVFGGEDARFAIGSFDYVYQRFLMFGVSGWPSHIASIARLVKQGGWLECIEPDMCIYSSTDVPISLNMPWYQAVSADAAAKGMDMEVGRNLVKYFQTVEALEDMRKDVFPFPTVMRPGKEGQRALIEQVPELFYLVVGKICGMGRSEEEAKQLAEDVKKTWRRGFNEGDHFDIFSVYAQKGGDAA